MWENFKNKKLKCWKNRIESVKNKIKKIKKWKNKIKILLIILKEKTKRFAQRSIFAPLFVEICKISWTVFVDFWRKTN